MDNLELLVDPAVSQQKFDFELKHLRALEEENIKRGWWVLKAEFPELFVVFATPKLHPPCVVFGVILDFTNYDYWPPSVRFVDPFTRQTYKIGEMMSLLKYRAKSPEGGPTARIEQLVPLVQAHEGGDPFLCLPGVREYHEHPAHTGDSWLTHRGTTEGSMYFLLDKIYQYGVWPINGYRFELRNIDLNIGGLLINIADIP